MAFDRTNPAHLLAAKDYITVTKGLDPITTGTNEILAHFNDPALNLTPQQGADKLTNRRLIDAVFTANVASQDQFKVQLLVEATNSLDEDVSDFREQIKALGIQLETAINAIQRDLNWVEVTFGAADSNGVWESITLTNQDWFAARNS